MKVLILGATGMVGDGVLHECLADSGISSVLAVTRSPLGVTHPKLRAMRRADFFDFSDMADELARADACFSCLGDSAIGLNEASYRRVTFDITLAAAGALAEAHPGATFCYVSGEGVTGVEDRGLMWVRVKSATENALLRLPLEAYMFRPGLIRPRRGVRSKTRVYRLAYTFIAPLLPLIERLAPKHVTSAANIGRAMIRVARDGYPTRILETTDINEAGGAAG